VENVTECALALLEWSGSADATSGSDERS
jgi:hypothetical protein